MYNVIIRFYEELNDLIPENMRNRDIHFSFSGKRSIKDLIESFGVPHVEIDLILANGNSIDFSYIINDADRFSVYPVFETLSIEGVTHLRPRPLRDLKFVLDVHLGKLARRLRLLGFDVDYNNRRDDEELANISHDANRILLTRDRQLLKRKNVSKGFIIRDTNPEEQILEIIRRLDLQPLFKPFSRCIECNGIIEKVSPLKGTFCVIKNRIPQGVLSWCNEFYLCRACAKIYWKGSHYDRLKTAVLRITDSANKKDNIEKIEFQEESLNIPTSWTAPFYILH